MFIKRKFIFGVLLLSAATATGEDKLGLGLGASLDDAGPATVATYGIDANPFLPEAEGEYSEGDDCWFGNECV